MSTVGKRLAKLLRLEVILAAFVLQPATRLAVSLLAGNMDVAESQTLALTVYVVLAWFTWKRQVVATWGTGLLLIINGALNLVAGAAALMAPQAAGPAPSLPFVLLNLLVGVYFLCGGVSVLRQRPTWKR
ncbi:hypothetical protein [Salidesulfovibrio brasiliensis]|uniref:hypothetical protein n=1 Tax=Salidesulfovibrio brasiliensis TaxID=221711 RepID=UPI0006D20D32|nr:hypothetical protein [Salidesulfovibrio brasiliensis]